MSRSDGQVVNDIPNQWHSLSVYLRTYLEKKNINAVEQLVDFLFIYVSRILLNPFSEA